MQDGILKFPKALKENKNVNNELFSKTPKNLNEPVPRFARKKDKENKTLTPAELEEENRLLTDLIQKNEKRVEALSRNEKIQDLFNIKGFINDHYKEFSVLLEDFKKCKAAEMNQKERRVKLERVIDEETKKRNFGKNADKTTQNLEEKIRRLQEDVEEMQGKNKKYHEQLNKKDFFREYDYMNREVEGLKKQNQNLELMLSKSNQENSTIH